MATTAELRKLKVYLKKNLSVNAPIHNFILALMTNTR
jgi:hypothetical protein